MSQVSQFSFHLASLRTKEYQPIAMFQSTRRRLALWYAACTAVLLLLFASCFYIYVRTTLIERVDDTLNHVVEVIERSLVFETIERSPLSSQRVSQSKKVNLDASFRLRSEAVEDDRIDLEWFGPSGEPLWSTFPKSLSVPQLSQQKEQTVTISEDYKLRQLTTPIEYDGELVGYMRASHPWFEVSKPTRQLIQDLAVGVSLTLGVVGIVGWFLSGIAIAPVIDSYQRLKQFTTDASHELRSPIASIQTNVQVALANPEEIAGDRHNWLVVERLAQRLGRLVDDLLFLARQDNQVSLPLQCCAMDALLVEVVEEHQLQVQGRGIEIDIAIGDDSQLERDGAYSVLGREDEMQRLMGNLLDNAIRYSPDEEKVEVKLEHLSRGSKLLQLQVKDSGVGIPQEEIPKVFNRFYRVDTSRTRKGDQQLGQQPTGSGLGLAIVKAIVDRAGGQIQVESEEGKGSCFTVLLPMAGERDCQD